MDMKLCCVENKSICKIVSVSGTNKCRLLEMGFTRNSIIQVINKNSKFGPIEIKIRNYNLAIRHEEAENIIVQIVGKEKS